MGLYTIYGEGGNGMLWGGITKRQEAASIFCWVQPLGMIVSSLLGKKVKDLMLGQPEGEDTFLLPAVEDQCLAIQSTIQAPTSSVP